LRWPLRLLGGLLALIALYVAAGFGLGAVATADPPPAGPIALAVTANLYHTDLVLPAIGAGIDWRARLGLPPEARFVAFGWGDRRFYLETPHITDLKLATALMALSGRGDAVVHVTWLTELPTGPEVHPLSVSEAQAAMLSRYVDRFIRNEADGKAALLAGKAYGSNDAFYLARGHWTPLLTCNEWLARGLRASHIRTGLWAPFTAGVIDHL